MRAVGRFFKMLGETLSERTKVWLILSILVICALGWALEHVRVIATTSGDFQSLQYVADSAAPAEQGQKLFQFFAYQFDVVLLVGFAIILASSLNLVNGHTGQFSLGHAGFMAVGAYISATVSKGTMLPPFEYPNLVEAYAQSGAGHLLMGVLKTVGWVLTVALNAVAGLLNAATGAVAALPHFCKFPAALLIGGALSAFTGLLVGVPSLRLRGDYLAIVTLGFNEIIRVVIGNYEPFEAQRGLGGIPGFTTFVSTFVWVAITIYVIYNLVNSTYGRGFLAVRDDEVAAEAMGINTTRYKVLAFVIAAFFAGIAGGLYAHFRQFITAEQFNFIKSVDIVVMVIIGGMGSIWGVALAATLLTIAPELLRKLGDSDVVKSTARYFSSDLPPEQQELVLRRTQDFFGNRMIFFALLLIIVMILRPQGLFGTGAIKKEKDKKGPPTPKPLATAATEVSP